MTLRASRPGRATPRLSVTVVNLVRDRAATAGLAGWLAGAAPRSAQGEVGIALMSDRRLHALNLTYRGVDRATDVLSFPGDAGRRTGRAGAAGQGSARRSKFNKVNYLGDIAIAAGVARRQAAAQGHALRTELRVLALHGLLHLLGYDHERDQGEMRKLEERLRRRAGLASGLIARTPNRAQRR